MIAARSNCGSSVRPRPTAADNPSGEHASPPASTHEMFSSPNRGFAYGNNRGLEQIGARYGLLLNPDTEIVEGTFGELVELLDARPQVGLAGVRQITADGTLWPTIRRFPSVGTRSARRSSQSAGPSAPRGLESACSTAARTSARVSATGPRARSCSRAARRC